MELNYLNTRIGDPVYLKSEALPIFDLNGSLVDTAIGGCFFIINKTPWDVEITRAFEGRIIIDYKALNLSEPRPLFQPKDLVKIKDFYDTQELGTGTLVIVSWDNYYTNRHWYTVCNASGNTRSLPEGVLESLNSTAPLLNPVVPLEEEPSGFLHVHYCRWCKKPIKRCISGEFKGHWQHTTPQNPFNPVNLWVCRTGQTIDGRPHLCEISLEDNITHRWKTNFETESDLRILPKGRKFK